MRVGNRGNGSLGDCLWLTPIAKAVNDLTVELHDDQQSREVGRIFEGIADVEHCRLPLVRPDFGRPEKTHTAQKILNGLGIDSVSCIPKIQLKKEEVEEAKAILSKFKNPIAIVNDNQGSNDPNNEAAQYKRPPSILMQATVNTLSQNGFTPIQFGRADKPTDCYPVFSPLSNCEYIRGLNLRILGACYRIIGKYIGGDTGDYHLMLAVGGKALVYIPEDNFLNGFDYSELIYFNHLWRGEKPRVIYPVFTNFSYAQLLASLSWLVE